MAAALLLPPALMAAPARLNAFPNSILGLWAFEPADCTNADSDGHLTIEARSVSFFVSGYDIDRIAQQPDGSLRASGLRSDEGKERGTRDVLTLKLIGPDQLRVDTSSSGVHVYHRCKAAAHPQR